ncbi:N-acetylglucosamine-6-phosphate deacetylase [Jeotgalibacillus campisalis]|uniref:N-acetylglucosamine-6-phosphate deacetylase n=1 Tax=Jeotgalibacillus campisalis TaxID=220754 RepID=A0A0C2RRG6_9BACL|nr:N-acetylglucosamine-6-phosphate deacetylase [Jeotgalibacillus campisalis]KIL52860.1 N-acetylglucosamine-6-phosphate deacetylase [Jeotgalibacillus campisalis]
MSQSTIIKNVEIFQGEGRSFRGDIGITDGKIQAVASHIEDQEAKVIDCLEQAWTAIPGFIDLHLHGAVGFDFMDAEQKAIESISKALPKEGTTSYLGTTMTQSPSAISKALISARQYMNTPNMYGQAEMLGIHLEGPFIASSKAGAQPSEWITAPDIRQFDQWQKESGHSIRVTTVAPETPHGQAFIEHVTGQGTVASIGHSDATFEDVREAVQNGARHVTHLYNQMSPLHHRKPGVVGAALLLDNLSVELIVDFIHTAPEAIELAYRQKGPEKTILITDSMRAKGLQDGKYDLGGQEVFVKEKEARLVDGTLAGSILTMQDAVLNMKKLTNLTIGELAAITSQNAAKQIGVWDRKGSIEIGKDADIVLINEQYEVMITLCRGEVCFQKEESL